MSSPNLVDPEPNDPEPNGPELSDADRALVAELLGRAPQGTFEIAVRHDDGTPRVIRNAPILDDGTPMPTLYWLVSAHDRLVVSRLESHQAVSASEAAVDAGELLAAHNAYRAERDELVPEHWTGHTPSAGVGGTRVGVKCLHAHYAYWLAGGDDPIGRWVSRQLQTYPDGVPDAAGFVA